MYTCIYLDDCSIGNAGVIHLSKTKWRIIDHLAIGIAYFIKERMYLFVKA
jgi:hypothetical protein